MDLIVEKSEEVSGTVEPEPSKFYTQFATVAGLLAEGESHIDNPLLVDDTRSLIKAIEDFGAETKRKKKQWTVWGTGWDLKPEGQAVDAKKSMTGLSLLSPLVALVPRVMIVTGNPKVRSRPIPTLIDALQEFGTDVHSANSDECPPLVSFGSEVSGSKIEFSDNMDPRFVPAPLLLTPFLEGATIVKIHSACFSDYLDIALELFSQCGIEFTFVEGKMNVKQGSYENFDVEVPPDALSALPYVVGSILTNSDVEVEKLDEIRNLEMFRGIMESFDIDLEESEDVLKVDGSQIPSGGEISLEEYPDLLPFLTVLSLKAEDKVRLTNAERARNMKSDRISTMAEGLTEMGASVEELEHGLSVDPPEILRGGEVNGRKDDSVVAALGIAGLISEEGTVVKNRAEMLRESYPHFVSIFKDLGADMSYGS